MARTMKSQALALSVALVALSLSGCHKGGAPQGGFPPSPVQAEPIVRGDIASTINVTSTVVPLLQASLSSVVSGNVILVSHQIGEHVFANELLVKIDDSTLVAQRAQAAGRLAQLLALYGGGTTTAQANLQSAKVADDTAFSSGNAWRSSRPVTASQSRTVRSPLPEMTTGRPFNSAAATAFTGPSWPVSGSPMGAPVARSHTRAV